MVFFSGKKNIPHPFHTKKKNQIKRNLNFTIWLCHIWSLQSYLQLVLTVISPGGALQYFIAVFTVRKKGCLR